MNDKIEAPSTFPPDRLALRPKQAAKALCIGERLLWSLTNQGLIPHIRLGRAVIYPVDQLKQWMADHVGSEVGS